MPLDCPLVLCERQGLKPKNELLDTLKTWSTAAVAIVTKDVLKHVHQEMGCRRDLCRAADGIQCEVFRTCKRFHLCKRIVSIYE
jgi:hypothetical protein